MLKKSIGICMLGLAVVLTVLIFGANPAISILTSRLIQKARIELLASGINSQIQISESSVSLPLTLNFSGISAVADIPKKERWGQASRIRLDLGDLSLGLSGLRPPGLKVSLSRLVLTLAQTEADASGVPALESVAIHADRADFIQLFSRSDVDNPRAAAVRLINELLRLLKGESSALPLQINGRLFLKIEGQPTELRFESRRADERTRILLNREDIARIGNVMDEGLTPAEVDLLCAHPADAPRLIAIQRYASRVAAESADKGSGVPEDAYRHVLWSYLLTRTYGPGFAKIVTDAHEVGENKRLNTPQDHAMDRHNNRIGADYAMKKLPESRVLETVLLDPAVVKSTADPRVN